MLSLLSRPWPWYVAGPLIGLLVPTLLILGNKAFGVSSSLRAMCAAAAPGRIEFLRYDWRSAGLWNIALVGGILLGGAFATHFLGVQTPDVSTRTRDALTSIGIHHVAGLAPAELLSWPALRTLRGVVCILGGGFLVGFGASYAGGCTSGHGITGLAARQPASALALAGFFAGGLLATFVILPLIS